MGKVVELKTSSKQLPDAELEGLCKKHPELKRLLATSYIVERDYRTNELHVVGSDDVDLILELFLAIAKVNNL